MLSKDELPLNSASSMAPMDEGHLFVPGVAGTADGILL